MIKLITLIVIFNLAQIVTKTYLKIKIKMKLNIS